MSQMTYQARLRELAVHHSDIQDRERRKLSKDIHSGVGHELGLARIKLSSILRGKDHNPDKHLMEKLLEIESHLKDAISQSRSLGYTTYPQVLDDAGLVPALRWLMEQYEDEQHIRIRLQVDPEYEHINFASPLRTRLFSAVRECVFNAWKFAEAEEIRIKILKAQHDNLELRIEDDGVGFDAEGLNNPEQKKGGFGLFSIREMLVYQGGDFHCESTPGNGTRICLTLPKSHVENL